MSLHGGVSIWRIRWTRAWQSAEGHEWRVERGEPAARRLGAYGLRRGGGAFPAQLRDSACLQRPPGPLRRAPADEPAGSFAGNPTHPEHHRGWTPKDPAGSSAGADRKSTRLNSIHYCASRMTSSACKKTHHTQDLHLHTNVTRHDSIFVDKGTRH